MPAPWSKTTQRDSKSQRRDDDSDRRGSRVQEGNPTVPVSSEEDRSVDSMNRISRKPPKLVPRSEVSSSSRRGRSPSRNAEAESRTSSLDTYYGTLPPRPTISDEYRATTVAGDRVSRRPHRRHDDEASAAFTEFSDEGSVAPPPSTTTTARSVSVMSN